MLIFSRRNLVRVLSFPRLLPRLPFVFRTPLLSTFLPSFLSRPYLHDSVFFSISLGTTMSQCTIVPCLKSYPSFRFSPRVWSHSWPCVPSLRGASQEAIFLSVYMLFEVLLLVFFNIVCRLDLACATPSHSFFGAAGFWITPLC